jgi:hypothetical protein
MDLINSSIKEIVSYLAMATIIKHFGSRFIAIIDYFGIAFAHYILVFFLVKDFIVKTKMDFIFGVFIALV